MEFIAGRDEVILDSLREIEEIGHLELLIKVTKEFIDKSLKIRKVIDWLEKTYPEKFKKLDMKMADLWDSSFNLTTLIQKFQSMLRCEWNNFSMSNLEADVETFIEAAQEIDTVLSKGIEHVNIMDNYSAGWLSPDGTFYGLNGEIANMLHNQIAVALQEKGMIPMYEGEEDERYFLKGDEDTKAHRVKVNPDAWLEQHGWVKIHGNNINFAGCLNVQLGKRNVDMTDKQIEIIKDYISNCHQCLIKAGWRLERASIGSFTYLALTDLPALYKKYFEF